MVGSSATTGPAISLREFEETARDGGVQALAARTQGIVE